jgi:DNA-binding GntR family transcriptional regulator
MNDSPATFQQQAYSYIKDQIFKIGFKPGEYITDVQIAGRLNISRTPVREAFHRLEQEGLLEYEARRGWRVYVLSLDDIREIFDLKIAVEGMVVAKAARCQDPHLRDQLKQALEDMHQAAIGNDVQQWDRHDRQLHEIVFQMAGNDRARAIIANLNDQWHRVRVGFVARTGRIERSIEEHSGFVQAILDGDEISARRQMEAHLISLRDELVNLLVTIVLPFVSEGV